MKRWFLLLPSLVLIGLLVFAFTGWRARRAQSAGRESAEGTSAQDLDALRGEIEALKRRSSAGPIYLVAPAPAAEVKASNTSDPSPEEAARQSRERVREAENQLAERFAHEGIDREWSTKTVRQIQDAVSLNAPGTRLSKAECASSLCRVVLTHDTEDIQREIGTVIAGLQPFQAGVFYSYDHESQPPKTTLFVARPGANFRDEPRSF